MFAFMASPFGGLMGRAIDSIRHGLAAFFHGCLRSLRAGVMPAFVAGVHPLRRFYFYPLAAITSGSL